MTDFARTPSQLGQLIRQARNERGMTQMQLGKLAGVRQATVSQIENGHALAQLEKVFAIISALDLEIELRPRSKFDSSAFEEIF